MTSTALYKLCCISIHASAKEATIQTFKGCYTFLSISIHASAKEATIIPVSCGIVNDFNPRLREGGDSLSVSLYEPDWSFQSTPPRRRRQMVG